MPQADNRTGVESETREKLGPLYWVVMHNDPVTTMDFVVSVLMKVYNMDYDTAVDTMYRIHNNGLEHVELMPLERAEFKVEMTHRAARTNGFPLTCTIEPDGA